MIFSLHFCPNISLVFEGALQGVAHVDIEKIKYEFKQINFCRPVDDDTQIINLLQGILNPKLKDFKIEIVTEK